MSTPVRQLNRRQADSRAKGTQCRLLYLIGQLGPGGSERQLYLLLKAMDRDLYRPEVVVWQFRTNDPYVRLIRELGISLHSLPKTFTRTAKLTVLRRLVRQIRPEVIHSYSFYTNFAAWWAARATNIISFGSCRGELRYERIESGLLLGYLSGRWPRNQICNSSAVAATIANARSVFVPERLRVVPNGLDLQAFSMRPISDCKPIVIAAVGSLLAVKRWDRLIDLADKLKVRGFNFVVRITGDGPLRKSLEQQAYSRGVADRVLFLGHSDDVPSVLAGATFVAHTSDSEACPNAVMEAMACGRAVIATNVGDIPKLIEEGRTGFVVNCEDNEALVDRTIRLMTNFDLCRQMGIAGRAKAERQFGLERLVGRTLGAYAMGGWTDAP